MSSRRWTSTAQQWLPLSRNKPPTVHAEVAEVITLLRCSAMVSCWICLTTWTTASSTDAVPLRTTVTEPPRKTSASTNKQLMNNSSPTSVRKRLVPRPTSAGGSSATMLAQDSTSKLANPSRHRPCTITSATSTRATTSISATHRKCQSRSTPNCHSIWFRLV